EDNCCQHICQKVGTEGYATETYEQDQRCGPENTNDSQMPPFEQRQQKEQKLSVKQSGTHRMPTGKTVTRPIHKRAVHKRPVPMNQEFNPLVKQHATGNANNQCD